MIKVDEDYYIGADTYCYAVMKKCGKDKNGNDTFRVLSYPSSLTSAIEYIMKYKQRQCVNENNIDLQEALKSFKKINEKMYMRLKEIEKLEELK